MKSHSRRAALRGQARLAQSCGCQDPRPETERPAGYARSSGEARVAPCPWHPSGTCGPPLGRRPHPWGSPLLLLPGTWPGPGGPLLPRSTPLLLAGGVTHTPQVWGLHRGPLRSSHLPVSPLAPLLPSFAKSSPRLLRTRCSHVLGLCGGTVFPRPHQTPHPCCQCALPRRCPDTGLSSPVHRTSSPGSACIPLPGKASWRLCSPSRPFCTF